MVYNKEKKKFITHKEFEDKILKKVNKEISLSEWEAALGSCRPNDSGITIPELMKHLNLTRSATRYFVEKGVIDGKIKKGRCVKKDCLGRIQIHTVYQIVKKGK